MGLGRRGGYVQLMLLGRSVESTFHILAPYLHLGSTL